jgi:inner membrane protein
MIVAGEVPLEFWRRQVMWRGDRLAGTVDYRPFTGARLNPKIVPLNLQDPRLAAARTDPDVRNFLFWSRMPMVDVEGGHAYLTDQRFFEAGRASSSNFLVPLDNPRPNS